MTFLNDLIGKSGVYFISPLLANPYPTPLVKIGLSVAKVDYTGRRTGGLFDRLSSYLLCYPIGFLVYAVLITSGPNASIVEHTIHRYYTAKNYKSEFDHSRAEEWYFVTPEEIAQTVNLISPGVLLQTYMFTENPMMVNTNGRVSNRPVQPMSDEAKRLFQASAGANVPSTEPRGVMSSRFMNFTNTPPPPFSIDEDEEEKQQ